MANQNAKSASAIVVCLVAGAPFAIPHAANAAECLTEPRQDTPQGQHWYYRLERGTKRHCWYLHEAAGKLAQTAQADDSSPAPSAVARNRNPTPRAIDDAHAELPEPQADAESGTGTPAQAQEAAAEPSPMPQATEASSPIPDPQQGDSQGGAISSRWPNPSDMASPSTTPLVVADAGNPAQTTQAEPAPAEPAPAPPAPAIAPAAKASVSLQMLLVVILAALALAGVTASVIVRFGRRRRSVRMSASERRAAIRESFDNAPRPPWVEPAIERTAPPQSNAPRSAAAPQTGTAKERYDKIEDVLALLMKHAQQTDA